jgi:hypothetical protein
MTVYIVTSKSVEKDTAGVILRVLVRHHGIFSDEGLANGLAEKYNATVTQAVLDQELVGNNADILEMWTNPGFARG